MIRRVLASGVPPEAVGSDLVVEHLFLARLTDPELVLRTSGEYCSSNILLRQTNRPWWCCSPNTWPDFGPADLWEALAASEHRLAN